MRRLSAPVLGLTIVGASLLSFMPAQAQTPAAPKFVNVKGFANGSTVHVTALQSGGTRLADVDAALASATVNGTQAGLTAPLLNEYNFNYNCPPVKDDKACAPSLAAKHSYARGSGLEVGVGVPVPSGADPNQLVLAGLAQSSAPKSSHDRQEIGPVPGDPLAYASVTRGDSTANWNTTGLVNPACVIGDDISRGIGYAADVQLVDAGAANSDGSMKAPVVSTDYTADDDVSQTTSRTFLVPNAGRPNNYGLRSEVVQTIAPVTLVKDVGTNGLPTSLITIKFLGQWKLDVTASGHAGGATVHYGPGTASPETPILQVFSGGSLAGQLLFQDLLGKEGVEIPGDPLIHVTLGEAPRAIAKPDQQPTFGSKPTTSADGTNVAAAVDVARIDILGGAAGVGTISVGHMEAAATVPAGGINCPIPVTKAVNPDKIHIGAQPDTARVTFNVLNPFDCDLTNVTLVDAIRQKVGDPDFILISSDPASDSPTMPTSPLRTADVHWSLGTIKQGQHRVVTMDVKSSKNGGILRDIATASGKLANCKGAGVAGLAISSLAIGQLTLTGVSPAVDINIELARTGPDSTRTAAVGGGIAAAAAAGAFTLRRRRRA